MPNIDDIGIHFIDTDYILTSKYKYNVSDYFLIGEDAPVERTRQVMDFLNADIGKIVMLSTFPDGEEYENTTLFIGIPILLNTHHKALVFYMMKYDSINTSFFSTQSSYQLRLCIFNNDGNLIYTNKPSKIGLLESKEFKDFVTNSNSNASISKYSSNDTTYTVFKTCDENFGKVFISIIPQDQVEESYRQFFNIMRNNAILIALGFILMLAVTAYICFIRK